MRALTEFITTNAILSWDRATTLQQDLMVSFHRNALIKERGTDIEDGLTHDAEYLNLLSTPLHIPSNASKLAKRAAQVMRETYEEDISEIIETENSSTESLSEHLSYQMQRFNEQDARDFNSNI